MENNRSTYDYNKRFINRDIMISNPGENNTDDNNLYNISSNFIVKTANLLYYCNPLPSFEDILA
jgi:hypothetical protein